ncbi:hypothetical protein YYC_02086 [Plasmodium yoelii 17X]|uniref:Fam-b protein n=4 Tax=Plasmodium yoelii TaxID=5861 RepID=A0AAE9WYQ1_PLAYO|nr:fam-b protein [Plasmodium yoelii]EAA21989.1 hypothetical protein [Plasmodium yoelii yoelii]ETB61160.1 hypothetical protein YYC_02086 [Plasmodium yoelii 17X]WBY58922.1 fam-b protein [Plasmodium yoelii yoelii]CDU19171.1 fam-b protein [Plasmodium yoelii]VTZ79756.1 fam-b protein [Plasmodium yoelii]|eukprot:XP_022812513.1 fam-b protein [Plasmodium yoelii]
MRISILKFVFFSIIICSFEYAKNELYFVNERDIYLERNITNFRNNRILADVDNRFNLNDFYQSTLNLVDQFNDCNGDEEITKLRNIIDSQIKKHKESNTLPDLNNVDKKTKKLINELLTELEEVKKEIDNKRNDEMAIQPIQDKRITKKDENISVSEHEGFNQLENEGNFLETANNKFKDEYHKIKGNKQYRTFKINEDIKRDEVGTFRRAMMLAVTLFLVVIASGTMQLLLLVAPFGLIIYKKWKRIKKYSFKL